MLDSGLVVHLLDTAINLHPRVLPYTLNQNTKLMVTDARGNGGG